MIMLQPQVIRELSERPVSGDSPVLSVFLNLDPASPTNRRGGHRLALDEMLKKIETQITDDAKRRHFLEDAAWARKQVELNMPKGRSTVMFCDVSGDFHFHEDLPIRLANQVWYGDTPYTRPLMQTLNEYERYGVTLVDKEKARFFVITMGIIQELSDALQSPPVRHRRTAGSDHMRSQMVLQRRAATWSGWFLKEVSEIMADMTQKQAIDRIILAGQEDVTAELYRLLPKALASRVIGNVRMSATARGNEVLEITRPLVEEIESMRERALVEDLITIAQKAQPKLEKAVLGLDATLDAVNQARVYRLVYPAGMSVSGYQCPSCEVLMDHKPSAGKCPYCSGTSEEVDVLLWLASERVLSMGGEVEEIQDASARATLNAAGQVGAYLR
jgi:peptide subunit release factor 1 (eRF1)